MQLVKGASSRWMNEQFKAEFVWQEGYGAFTLGVSQKDDTIAYIQRQAETSPQAQFRRGVSGVLKEKWRGV
jgi:hypothetical protein